MRKPPTAIVPPNRYSQYANAFSRGNDTSGAPIWIGTTKFANANTIGVAKNSSMIVPCMVNSWLYCSGDRNCMPGRASSARMSSAIRPPSMKNTKDVIMYMIPICFASVVRSIRAIAEPLTWRRTGQGRVTIGFGATVVTMASGVSFVPLSTSARAKGVPRRQNSPPPTPAGRGVTKDGDRRHERRDERPVLVREDPLAPPAQHRVAQRGRHVAGAVALAGCRSRTSPQRGRRRASYAAQRRRHVAAAAAQLLGEHHRVLERHRGALGQRRRGGVRGVADQQHRARATSCRSTTSSVRAT